MEKQIQFEGSEAKMMSPYRLVRITNITPVYGVESIQMSFPKELKKIAIDEFIDGEVNLEALVQKIVGMKRGCMVMKNNIAGRDMFLVVETEVQLGGWILLRRGMKKNRMVATGSIEEVRWALLDQVKKEFPGKLDKVKAEEIDDGWIESFSLMYYGSKHVWEIIVV